MDKIYIFDVDGTLTPSRLRMTKEFAKFFDEWTSENIYYLVTGSDLKKTKEQVPLAYMDRAHGVFTCCGNQFWETDPAVHPQYADLIYDNKFTPPESLIEYLKEKIKSSKYYCKTSNHIENRGSMVNFSVVGRDCTQEQREDYYEWDNKVSERKNIANNIKSTWTKLDAVIGGQISIDIYPKGKDKSQVLKYIRRNHSDSEYIFIGDGIENGGNDYPLAKLMEETNEQFGRGYKWYQTKDWKQTKEILEKLSD